MAGLYRNGYGAVRCGGLAPHWRSRLTASAL